MQSGVLQVEFVARIARFGLLGFVLAVQACGRTASQSAAADAAADSVGGRVVLEARADSLHRWLGGDAALAAGLLESGTDPDIAVLGLTRRFRTSLSEWRGTTPGADSLPESAGYAALADSVIALQRRRIEPRLERALAVVPEVAELCDRSPASWYCRLQNPFRRRQLTPRMAMALDTLTTLGETAEYWGTAQEDQYWKDIGWLAGYYKRYLVRRLLVTREWVEWDEAQRRGVISEAGRVRERLAQAIEDALLAEGCRGCWAVAADSDFTTLRVLDTRADSMANDYRAAPLVLWEAGFIKVEYRSSPGTVYAIHRRFPDR